MAIKQDRLSGIIRREVSDIIQFELKNKNTGLVTVTDVSVTGDLSIAKVYVTILGKNHEEGLEQLKRAKGFIRSMLGKRLSIRKCPDLIFVLDTSLETGNRIQQLIQEVKDE
ncbi:MAG: 30S ribosome-binding factor RbfA [Erysipelotrichaceae bacterium]|nr:30S ribosome-binding factor RbfA [Erysipelotrichaceae bacterium]